MRRKAGTFTTILGIIFVAMAIFQYSESRVMTHKALAEAKALTDSSPDEVIPEAGPSSSPDAEQSSLSGRAKFAPKKNDVIGVLQIPKIKAELPIIEGTDEEMLERGVGHYSTSAFPLDNEQIVLSGHRDTVFRNFGKLELGDRLTVKMPYGTFEYEISSTDIVDKDDTSVIRSMGKEVLVLTTCYPFRYVGNAPKRYIIYAYPVTEGNTKQTESAS